MTVALSNNFDAEAVDSLAGLTLASGTAFKVKVATALSLTAVSGANVFAAASNNDASMYLTGGVIGDQAVALAAKIASRLTASFRSVGITLRATSNGGASYRGMFETDNVALRAHIARFNGGTISLASTAYVFTPGPTDVVRYEFYALGSDLIFRAWIHPNTPPTATVASATEIYIAITDATLATGYRGIRHNGVFAWAAADNMVITDGAGGEDFFYSPTPTTINCTVGNATAAGAQATITNGQVTISCAVGNAAAAGSAANIIVPQTIACATGNATANGSAANVANKIMSDIIINNTGTPRPAESANWYWHAGGLSASAATSSGTTVTDANARLSPGITYAAGDLILKIGTDVYFESFA